jgi:chemotaxis protein methyltransferase CheR
LTSIDELCQVLQCNTSSPLNRHVVEALTTNETYFFREPLQYEALRKTILPQLLELRKDTRRLRFWSAASSTGQEAYSLAMLLLELDLQDWNIEILATDLTSKVLERAASGRYSQLEVNRGLPAQMLLKYFRRKGLDWELIPAVTKMVRFRQLDLRRSLSAFGPFDAVFCRNVLIYFDMPTRQAIVESIHGTLFRGGCLLLGSTELGSVTDHRYARHTQAGCGIYAAL